MLGVQLKVGEGKKIERYLVARPSEEKREGEGEEERGGTHFRETFSQRFTDHLRGCLQLEL